MLNKNARNSKETVKYILCLTVAYEGTCCFKQDIYIKQRIISIGLQWLIYLYTSLPDRPSIQTREQQIFSSCSDRQRQNAFNLYKTVEVLVFVLFYSCIFLVVLYLFALNRHFIARPAIKGLTFRISDFIFSLLSVLRWGWRGNYSSDDECLLTALYKETEDERPIGRIFLIQVTSNFRVQSVLWRWFTFSWGSLLIYDLTCSIAG